MARTIHKNIEQALYRIFADNRVTLISVMTISRHAQRHVREKEKVSHKTECACTNCGYTAPLQNFAVCNWEEIK